MDEKELLLIERCLDAVGLKYRSTPDFIQTFWLGRKKNQIQILIFSDHDWLTISSIIPPEGLMLAEKKEEMWLKINDFNLKNLGVKFVLDKNGHFLIIYQSPIETINGDLILIIAKLIVQTINDLYNP
jgi:chaperone required for assembly of F1-ATPase